MTTGGVGARRGVPGVLYSLYAAGVALLVAALCWPFVVVVPSTIAWRYRVVRLAGTTIRQLVGVPLVVEGALPSEGPFVVVANHRSFIDGVVLIVALEVPLTFVVGAAFARMRIVGRFLGRIGCVFVGSGTTKEALALTDSLVSALRRGRSIASFPEGGLAKTADLRTFRLGTFKAAVDAGVPVVPVAIAGSGEVLPPGWPPIARPGHVRVSIGAPLQPVGTGWRAHIALRNAAHDAVAALLEGRRA